MKYWKFFIKLFILFFFGSIFGFVIENIVELLTHPNFHIRQGLLYGPFIPVYGIGAMMFYIILRITDKPIAVFIVSVIIGGAVEFCASLWQEKMFGTISWDYSNSFMNLGGRTSLLYCICWGLIGLVFLYILPYLDRMTFLVESKECRIVIYALMFLMLCDIGVSIVASMRQTDRKIGLEPRNKIEIFLDRYYPDDFLDRVYNNKTWVK